MIAAAVPVPAGAWRALPGPGQVVDIREVDLPLGKTRGWLPETESTCYLISGKRRGRRHLEDVQMTPWPMKAERALGSTNEAPDHFKLTSCSWTLPVMPCEHCEVGSRQR